MTRTTPEWQMTKCFPGEDSYTCFNQTDQWPAVIIGFILLVTAVLTIGIITGVEKEIKKWLKNKR